MLPYEHDTKQLKLAMRVGGEYRIEAMRPRSFAKLAEALAIDSEVVLERARDLATGLPDAVADVATTEDVRAMVGSDLPSRLLDRVAAHAGRCRIAIERHLARPDLDGRRRWCFLRTHLPGSRRRRRKAP